VEEAQLKGGRRYVQFINRHDKEYTRHGFQEEGERQG
jgi:hypothetical protein